MKARAFMAVAAVRTTVLPVGLICAAAAAVAQPATAILFSNGLSEITVEPGTAVLVTVYATGLPNVGTPIPWTTPPGTGQLRPYAGFASVLMNLHGTGSINWSGLSTPPPFVGPPFGTPGQAIGPSVTGIHTSIGFNHAVAGSVIPLWSGTVTVGAQDVLLATEVLPYFSPLVGFEMHVDGAPSPLNYSHIMAATNGSAVIHLPSPAAAVIIGIAGLGAARRRRHRFRGSLPCAQRVMARGLRLLPDEVRHGVRDGITREEDHD